MSIQNPGPTSSEGKAISSLNATKHGCCADTLILKSENITDYQALEASWFNSYSPVSDLHKHLVQEAVNADWFHQRATRFVAQTEAELIDINPSPLHWTEDQHRVLARLLRYQATRANNANRARKALESFRKDRSLETQTAEKSVNAKQRLEIYKVKNTPEPSIHHLIEQMMARKREKDRLAQAEIQA